MEKSWTRKLDEEMSESGVDSDHQSSDLMDVNFGRRDADGVDQPVVYGVIPITNDYTGAMSTHTWVGLIG